MESVQFDPKAPLADVRARITQPGRPLEADKQFRELRLSMTRH